MPSSNSETLRLCQKLELGLNAFIVATSRNRETKPSDDLTDSEIIALVTLFRAFLEGIAPIIPKDHRLLVSFENKNGDSTEKTTLELDLADPKIETLANHNNNLLDETYMPNFVEMDPGRVYDYLAGSIRQRFPLAYIKNMIATVDLVSKL